MKKLCRDCRWIQSARNENIERRTIPITCVRMRDETKRRKKIKSRKKCRSVSYVNKQTKAKSFLQPNFIQIEYSMDSKMFFSRYSIFEISRRKFISIRIQHRTMQRWSHFYLGDSHWYQRWIIAPKRAMNDRPTDRLIRSNERANGMWYAIVFFHIELWRWDWNWDMPRGPNTSWWIPFKLEAS